MAWQELVMSLERPSCPEAKAGSRVSCIRPGDGGAPIAYLSKETEGWDNVGPDGLARRQSACTECPARQLPRALVVRCMDIADGQVTVHAMAPERADVRAALDAMQAAGEAPSIRRIRASEDDRRPSWIDLGALSPRQWEALQGAHQIGYFSSNAGVDQLAEVMGCGRSAAHEHLRKAVARLVGAAVDRTGPGPRSQG